jgi:hypothetical protein
MELLVMKWNGSWKKLASMGILVFSLTACKQTIEFKNGEVPSEFIPQLQRVLGKYHGQMNQHSMDLRVSLAGNRLVIKVSDDLIDSSCKSRVGNLLKVSYEQSEDQSVRITDAVFELDPNLCNEQIRGRKLYFRLEDAKPIIWSVKYLSHTQFSDQCGSLGNLPYDGYPHCAWHQVEVYERGYFTRK